MIKSNSLVLALTLCLVGQFISSAYGYELATHAALTQNAYEMSELNNTDKHLVKDLGIDIWSSLNQPFGITYYDVSGTVIKERTFNAFEGDIIKKLGIDPLTFKGWLMRGAIREDDSSTEANPHDDASYNPDLKRPLNHFFDPINNRPLTVTGLSLVDSNVHKAPDWAMGSADIFTQPNAPETGRRNHFTVFDAREAMWRALTLKLRNADGSMTDILPSGSLTTKEAVRKAYWATTFRALGDILHLNQDMAQPQHTRNEPHSGYGSWLTQALFMGHTSIFERYIDARAKGDAEYNIDGSTVKSLTGLTYGNYPIPVFPRYSDYWSTSPGPGSLTGKGLADYSNHGFFTAAHNLGDVRYASPPNTAESFTVSNTPYPLPVTGTAHRIFLEGTVHDAQTGIDNTIKLTTQSLWDGYLIAPTYSLTRLNYDDMAALLIPRAVGYSAGLLNHFFRGRMDVSLPTLDALNPSEGVYGLVDVAQTTCLTFNLSPPSIRRIA